MKNIFLVILLVVLTAGCASFRGLFKSTEKVDIKINMKSNYGYLKSVHAFKSENNFYISGRINQDLGQQFQYVVVNISCMDADGKVLLQDKTKVTESHIRGQRMKGSFSIMLPYAVNITECSVTSDKNI